MRIRELSLKTGASLRSLRYYEEQGLLHPRRQTNGYREYREADIDWVKTIQLFLSLGTTTEELARFLRCQSRQECANVDGRLVAAFYENKLAGIRRQMRSLREAEKLLENRLLSWRENSDRPLSDIVPDKGKRILQEELKRWIE